MDGKNSVHEVEMNTNSPDTFCRVKCEFFSISRVREPAGPDYLPPLLYLLCIHHEENNEWKLFSRICRPFSVVELMTAGRKTWTFGKLTEFATITKVMSSTAREIIQLKHTHKPKEKKFIDLYIYCQNSFFDNFEQKSSFSATS